MRRVIIESPYAGDVAENLRYLRACMRDCLLRGETPYASHALYTQGVLDDLDLEERNLGINAGFEWRAVAEATVVYLDRGWSSGMRRGIEHAERIGHPVELRSLPGWSIGDDVKALADAVADHFGLDRYPRHRRGMTRAEWAQLKVGDKIISRYGHVYTVTEGMISPASHWDPKHYSVYGGV